MTRKKIKLNINLNFTFKVFFIRSNMDKCLNDIYHIDKQMIQNHQVTCENHEQLLMTLKKINTIIQNASRLRGIYVVIYNIVKGINIEYL